VGSAGGKLTALERYLAVLNGPVKAEYDQAQAALWRARAEESQAEGGARSVGAAFRAAVARKFSRALRRAGARGVEIWGRGYYVDGSKRPRQMRAWMHVRVWLSAPASARLKLEAELHPERPADVEALLARLLRLTRAAAEGGGGG